MSILIKKPLIVNGDETFTADILVNNGKIWAMGKDLQKTLPSTKVIEAEGLYAFPGGIDPHVHLALPTPAGNSSDDFLSGSIAALAGGTTTIIDFVTPSRNQSLSEAYRLRKKVAENSLVDYKFHMGISGYNENTSSDIAHCIYNEGITSFKAYLAYRNSIGIDFVALEKLMKQLAANNVLLLIHCEEGEEIEKLQKDFLLNGHTSPLYHALSRPEKTESEAVARVLELVESTGCNTYLVHISTQESIELIKKFKTKARVYAETCPQYLLLDKENYSKPLRNSLKFVISPPLRDKKSMEALWDKITDGTIDVISTDHCPFNTFGQKNKGANNFTRIPNGAGGIEYRLPLLFTYGVLQNRISLQRFVELTSTNAAKIFGLYPRKGIIAVASDADMVLWNPDTESTIDLKSQFQHCDSNIYKGLALKGAAEYVFSHGKIAFKQGEYQNSELLGSLLV
jgi:dihydropyrimidinase